MLPPLSLATTHTRQRVKPVAAPPARDGQAEARLIDIYRLIGQGQTRAALGKAEVLVRENPNFQLAQLVTVTCWLRRRVPCATGATCRKA
jgi:hypothetical protein